MSKEIINELKERSTKFMNWIELTVDDENAIKAAIAYFEFEESALKAILKLAQIDLAVVTEIDLQNTSLTALIKKYNVDSPFNKESANKDFKNGLELIITQNYSYNGIFYHKGNDKRWI
tara:strand:+ start:2361 stop:2717 length:357 start_codon:yes stop_codon:yes gene_type:complete